MRASNQLGGSPVSNYFSAAAQCFQYFPIRKATIPSVWEIKIKETCMNKQKLPVILRCNCKEKKPSLISSRQKTEIAGSIAGTEVLQLYIYILSALCFLRKTDFLRFYVFI